MTEKDTPLMLLSVCDRKYPGHHRVLDAQTARGTAPSDAALYFLASRCGVSLSAAPLLATPLAACHMWQLDKRIYFFDDALASALVQQAEDMARSDTLPFDILFSLSSSAFYVKAPNVTAPEIDGFFLWKEQDADVAVLQIAFLYSDMLSVVPGTVRLSKDKPLSQCLPDLDSWLEPYILAAANGNNTALKVCQEHVLNNGPMRYTIHNLVIRALQLVLYLSCENAEIAPFDPPAASQDVYPLAATTHVVGRNTGQKLRYAAETGSQNARKAHTRRGHWHNYWTGPKTGPRVLKARWIAPVFVGQKVENIDVIPVT